MRHCTTTPPDESLTTPLSHLERVRADVGFVGIESEMAFP